MSTETDFKTKKHDAMAVHFKLINEALLGKAPQFSYCENFNDIHSGWDISPAPGDMLRYMVEAWDRSLLDESRLIVKNLRIEAFSISPGGCGIAAKVKFRVIYDGPIPADIAGEDFDYSFIQQIVRNYKNFLK